MSRLHRISGCMLAIALTRMPALTSQEPDPAPPRMKAMTLEKQGLNAEAEQIWDSIAKADPRDAEALAHLGLLEARQDHYEKAIDYYRRADAINPDLPGLQMNIGLALFKAAQFPEAIRFFSSEIKKHPGDPGLTLLIGMSHYGMMDYFVAIPYLQRAAEHDPQSINLRLTLARSCLWSKQYPCVLKVHKEILALQAESAEADMLAGEALDQMRDSDGAAKEFRAAALLNPKQPNVHFGLGYLLWTQERWAEAAVEFQLELENDPRHAKARVYLADSWVRLNQFAKALPELETLASSYPTEPLVHRDLGLACADAGRTADAIRELKIAVASDPEDAQSRRQLATLYRSSGSPDAANSELDDAKRLSPPGHAPLQELIDSIENPAP